MKKKKVVTLQLISVFVSLISVSNTHASTISTPRNVDQFFQNSKLWEIHIKLTEENHAALTPNGWSPDRGEEERRRGRSEKGALRGKGPADARTSQNPREDRGEQRMPHKFDLSFEYVRAEVTVGDKVFKDVGVRYKGNSSFGAARNTEKKSFKFDFNRFVRRQKFLGLTKINLNNALLDPSQMREVLAYGMFREAGLPAPRTTYARVFLTIGNQHEEQLLGLYVVVEQVNDDFLKRHFSTDNGLLLKPEPRRDFPYLGEELDAYKSVYGLKSDSDVSFLRRLADLTKLVNHADDNRFADQIESYIDFKQFATFTGLHVVLSHLDSFIGRGHNHYIYLPKSEGKFTWVPWDLDAAFAGVRSSRMGAMSVDLSVTQPSQHHLIKRLLGLKKFQTIYLNEVKRLSESLCSPDTVTRQISKLRKVIEFAVKEDPNSDYKQFLVNFKSPIQDGTESFTSNNKILLLDFLKQRQEAIHAQLSLGQKGYIPDLQMRPSRK